MGLFSRLLGATTTEPESPGVPEPIGMSVNVVGTDYHDGWGRTRGRAKVLLVREPHNSHDANAVAVQFRGSTIGYLPRERAMLAAPCMDKAGLGETSTVANLSDDSAVVSLPAAVFPALSPRAGSSSLRPSSPWGRCRRRFEIEFEHEHRDSVARVFERRGIRIPPDGTTIKDAAAILLPTAHPMAPAVVVDGQWVGNLVDPAAEEHARCVLALADRGLSMMVYAEVWALNDRGTIRSRVSLRAPEASEMIAPPMPAGRCVLLPHGSTIQVTGEESFLPDVSGLLQGRSLRHVAAELRRAPQPGKGKERLEVGVEGRQVGWLTPAMSEQLLPIVTLCETKGLTVVCRAVVKGNQIKADVTLDTAKAGDLTDDWLARFVHSHPSRP